MARKWNISARSVYRILKRTSKGQGALP
ncbi:hypothetical protein EBQ24_02905 [Allofranklinella schreckenbergeri]|uniref:Uncharacterized protein n=1 Tax=Allofranklinella schreckenbergeri TaxID=1076744 RepID=A0A3M6R6H0_9BURK|nr:hypothetical protein EBQ24_02905 [Allofranklinella schreckenbergeri]